jgi:hypothetical protein
MVELIEHAAHFAAYQLNLHGELTTAGKPIRSHSTKYRGPACEEHRPFNGDP